MTTNMGLVDRLIRVAFAVTLIILYVSGQISGIFAVLSLIFSTVLILTSYISLCPLYWPLGITTKKKSTEVS